MKTKLSVVFLSIASKPASSVTGSPRGAEPGEDTGMGGPAAPQGTCRLQVASGLCQPATLVPMEAEDPPWWAGGSCLILLEPSFRPRHALNHRQLPWLLLCLLVWTCLPPYHTPRPPTTPTTTLCGRDLVVTGSRVCVLCPLDTQLSSCWLGPVDFGGRGRGEARVEKSWVLNR